MSTSQRIHRQIGQMVATRRPSCLCHCLSVLVEEQCLQHFISFGLLKMLIQPVK
ncbi:hypothetical protein HOLleu_20813 [Holothuria leucospilota]|uniref:Uncharacterized protein n=1 Tax=Holothuria leucospilota TaxID=206669 RepID=A0A9Q1H893_HOLLE|nr:hypothetical protein HOLleu_20813 [Holothuria leucospilota]